MALVRFVSPVLRRTITIAAVLCLAPAAASGQTRDAWTEPGPQWAKVNVCEPEEVGVRASLPGDGGGGGMAARFTLEWLNPATEAWEPVEGKSVSPWVDAGPADVGWAQVGYTFQLEALPDGDEYSFRGVAELRLAGGGAATLTTPGTCVIGD